MVVDANAYKIGKHFTIYVEAVNLNNAPQRLFRTKERTVRKQLYSYWGRAGVKIQNVVSKSAGPEAIHASGLT